MSCSVAFCGENNSEYYQCKTGHPIHRTCARKWALQVPDHYSCPLCRAEMVPPSILSEREKREVRSLQHRVENREEALEVIAFADEVLAEADRAIADQRKYSWRDVAELIAYIPPVLAFIHWVDREN